MLVLGIMKMKGFILNVFMHFSNNFSFFGFKLLGTSLNLGWIFEQYQVVGRFKEENLNCFHLLFNFLFIENSSKPIINSFLS
jgi:hypothetical protein